MTTTPPRSTPTTADAAAPRPSRRRRRGGAAIVAGGLALALALVLTAAGCSSSSEGADPTTTAGVPATGSGSPGTAAPAGTEAPATGGGDGDATTTTTEAGPTSTLALDASEQPYVDALVAEGTTGMTGDQTACLAGYSVRAIGVDTLQAAGITPEAMASGDKSFNDLTIDEATATEMVDGFEPCGIDIVDYFLQGIGESVPDPTVMSCIEGRLTEDVARSLYITAISTGGGGTAVQDFLAPCVKK